MPNSLRKKLLSSYLVCTEYNYFIFLVSTFNYSKIILFILLDIQSKSNLCSPGVQFTNWTRKTSLKKRPMSCTGRYCEYIGVLSTYIFGEKIWNVWKIWGFQPTVSVIGSRFSVSNTGTSVGIGCRYRIGRPYRTNDGKRLNGNRAGAEKKKQGTKKKGVFTGVDDCVRRRKRRRRP